MRETTPVTTVVAAASPAGGTLQPAATQPGTLINSSTTLATFELIYFKAVSMYRRRNYERCAAMCNAILQHGHENNVQMFVTAPADGERDGNGYAARPHNATVHARHGSTNLPSVAQNQRSFVPPPPPPQQARATAHSSSGNNHSNNNNNGTGDAYLLPAWIMEGVWQLKMRALTQRVYIDELDTEDNRNEAYERGNLERIATTARPGTSIKTAFVPRPRTAHNHSSSNSRMPTKQSSLDSDERRKLTSSSSTRPSSGMVRPSTALSRPGSSLGNRPASRCGTASRIRATSAVAFTIGDETAPLYQASRLNPTIYAERSMLVKALFLFLYYHEADVTKAYSLCEAVIEAQKKHQRRNVRIPPTDWWWDQQMGRCLLAMRHMRKAEGYLQQSLAIFPHPDTYLLLSRLYMSLNEESRALQLITSATERYPFDVTYRLEEGRVLDGMGKPNEAMSIYRLVSRLNPINLEALTSIALSFFYDNNPELALMYYRRILSLGAHSAELYCNIALCCLYGGQLDLVLPCFQRALLMASSAEQKADIWYNLSFVAISTGDFALARRCLQLCLTFDARYSAALNNMAVLSAHGGDWTKARTYLNAAKELRPDTEADEIATNIQYMETKCRL